MKYVLVEEMRNDSFVTEFETKEEAIKESDKLWDSMCDNDKARCEAFYVLESANEDEDADNHLDGDYVKIYQTGSGSVMLPCGKIVSAAAIEDMMDEEILEQMEHEQWYVCDQDLFDDYCTRHAAKYGEPFELAKENPVW